MIALSYMFKFRHCWLFKVPYVPLISIAALIKAHLVFLHLVLCAISQLYPGFISDKDIVARSGFLNPAFWEAGDSVKADRDFNI